MKIILLCSCLLLAGCDDFSKIQQTDYAGRLKIDCTDSSGQKIVHMKIAGSYFNDGSIVTKLVDTKTMIAPANCIISTSNEVNDENN